MKKSFFDIIQSDLSRFGAFNNKKITIFRMILGYFGSKNVQAVLLYRLANLVGKKSNILGNLVANHSLKETGADIKWRAEIDEGFRIGHPVGIVISEGAKIGKYCTIYQGVTIGKNAPEVLTNDIGDNVVILPGAKVLTGKIGNNVIIGPNSVVLDDVPDNCTVVGIPARIVKLNGQRVDISLKEYNKRIVDHAAYLT